MEHIQWQREEIRHKCDSYKLINDYCYGWENSSINHLLKYTQQDASELLQTLISEQPSAESFICFGLVFQNFMFRTL